MRRFAWCLAAVCLVAACGSSARVSTPSSTSTTSTTRAGTSTGALRGTRVRSLECPPHPLSSAPSAIPIEAVQTLLLCPLPGSSPSADGITVDPGGPNFDALLTALSEADEPATPGAVCPLYADLQQVVLAQAGDRVYQVSIPSDACRHYERDALDALNRARAA